MQAYTKCSGICLANFIGRTGCITGKISLGILERVI